MTNEGMQAAIKELEETATVMAHLQARQAEMLKDHAEWLHSHDKAMAETREAGKATDERIEKFVAAIGKLISDRN